MKPYVKIALIFVFVFAVVSILIAVSMYFKKPGDLATTKPDYVLTSTVLQKEFEDNEKNASEKYIKKILEVNGSISSVTKSDSGSVNISLKTGSDLSAVSCEFPKNTDPSKFSVDKEITIRGECEGFLMDVQLKNCAVILKK